MMLQNTQEALRSAKTDAWICVSEMLRGHECVHSASFSCRAFGEHESGYEERCVKGETVLTLSVDASVEINIVEQWWFAPPPRPSF